ncbi:MAG: tRNA (adenosine(37)-N6)-threonylcarbamoyltransferase complex ATPase subunit type 1 TsaE [Bacteroidales bacterium]
MKLELKTLENLENVADEFCRVLHLSNRNLRKNWIGFFGEMGAGKTTLIKAVCQKLGVGDVISSPTFSLVNEYVTSKGEKIFHFDFYRMNNVSEAFDLGYEEYFYSGNLCMVEWPEKIEHLLPEGYTKVNISVIDNNCREINIS